MCVIVTPDLAPFQGGTVLLDGSRGLKPDQYTQVETPAVWKSASKIARFGAGGDRELRAVGIGLALQHRSGQREE